MNDQTRELAQELRGIDERLRDLALDRLSAASAGDEKGLDDERRIQRAIRGVARAIDALDGSGPDDF